MLIKPKVELLNYTPLAIADQAIGQCWGKGCFEGDKLKERMTRVANKFKHKSTIEHLNYNFHISDISRALLQELARHRISSFSVKSSRYTLGELKNDPIGLDERGSAHEWAEQYVVLTDDVDVNNYIIKSLSNLQQLVANGISNDITKYAMPEAFKTELVWSVNARSLQNFLELRTSKSALKEIQNLAHEIYKQLPEEHKFLFTDSIKNTEGK